MKKRKILSALLCLVMVFSLCLTGCGEKNEADESKLSCTITVTAADVLENKDLIKADKLDIVPDDGIIYSGTAYFNEGDTIYDVLTKTLESEKIHYEAQNSSYFIAFGNIYASDCENGGWLYSINEEEPPIGANEYKLKDKDVVKFFYICDCNEYFGSN